MSARFHKAGNRFTHEVHADYRHAPRVPGPVEPMDYPRVSLWHRLFPAASEVPPASAQHVPGFEATGNKGRRI